jgi:hypothetical protein
LGDCLLWAVFENFKSRLKYLGRLFIHGKSYLLILSKKWFGLHFGRIFQKLIWSLWLYLATTSVRKQLPGKKFIIDDIPSYITKVWKFLGKGAAQKLKPKMVAYLVDGAERLQLAVRVQLFVFMANFAET